MQFCGSQNGVPVLCRGLVGERSEQHRMIPAQVCQVAAPCLGVPRARLDRPWSSLA